MMAVGRTIMGMTLWLTLLSPLATAHVSSSDAHGSSSQLASSRFRAPPALASIFTDRKLITHLPKQGGRTPWIGEYYEKQRREQTDLLCFYGNDCEMCEFMAKYIKEFEAEHPGMKIRRFETWSNRENDKLRMMCDSTSGCGGVPFFYNRKTKAWICGATSYDNLRRWALGKSSASFLPPATQFKSQQAAPSSGGPRRLLADLRERSREMVEERRRLAEEARELQSKQKARR